MENEENKLNTEPEVDYSGEFHEKDSHRVNDIVTEISD